MKIAFQIILTGFLLTEISFSQNRDNYSAPEWAEGIIWYQIFPERFRNGDQNNDPNRERAKGPENWQISDWTGDWYARDDWESDENFYHTVFNRRYGGDLQGVIDKLDYLKDLGVGGIYFNPIFDAQSLHKYDASYYHHIDRNFGPDPEGDVEIILNENPNDPATWSWTSADSLFLKLLEEAHSRELKVIIDGVWNHTGTEFWAFQDLAENQENSEFKEWYIVTEYDDPATPENEFDYEGWWGVKDLPVFKEENENLIDPIKQHIFEITKRWMDPNGDGDPSDGIDGWRLDVTEEVGKNFWKEWHELVFSINPDAVTIAEIWTDNAKEYISGDMFTSVMNYRFAYAAKDFIIDGTINAEDFVSRLKQIKTDYPEGSEHVLQNLMDSHDTPRLSSMIVNPGLEYDREVHARDGFDVRKPNAEEWQIQKLVALFQFTWQGAPMIYYGTESGMWGADDPDDRKPMLWDDLVYEPEKNHPFNQPRAVDTNQFNHDLFNYYAALATVRNNHPALQKGEAEFILVDSENEVVAFNRSYNSEIITILLNRSDRDQKISIPFGKDAAEDLLNQKKYKVKNGILELTIPSKSGLILK